MPLFLRLTSHFILNVSPLTSELRFTDFCTDISAGSPSNSFPFTLLAFPDVLRWLLHLLQRLFRFKNRCFFNFSMMYTMLIFYYIEQWPYFPLLSFPTLNQHLFPAQTYGTNLKGSDHTTRTGPMPSLTLYTSLRPTSLRKKPLWMSCWNPTFLNHINMLLPLHLTPFQNHRSSHTPHQHLRNANRKPKLLPKHLRNAVAFANIRDPAPRARCRRGPSKTNKNFVRWSLMKNLDFHGVWSRPRWANLKRTFDLCGTSSKTNLADYLRRENRKRTSHGIVLPFSIYNFVCRTTWGAIWLQKKWSKIIWPFGRGKTIWPWKSIWPWKWAGCCVKTALSAWKRLCQRENDFASVKRTLPAWKRLCQRENDFASVKRTLPAWKQLCQCENNFATMKTRLASVKTSFASVKATLPAWMQFLPARGQLYHCASQKDSFICKILSVLASLAGVLKYELVPSGLSERSLGTRHIHV